MLAALYSVLYMIDWDSSSPSWWISLVACIYTHMPYYSSLLSATLFLNYCYYIIYFLYASVPLCIASLCNAVVSCLVFARECRPGSASSRMFQQFLSLYQPLGNFFPALLVVVVGHVDDLEVMKSLGMSYIIFPAYYLHIPWLFCCCSNVNWCVDLARVYPSCAYCSKHKVADRHLCPA